MKTYEFMKEGPAEARRRPFKTAVNALTIMTVLAAPLYVAGCEPGGDKRAGASHEYAMDPAHAKTLQRQLATLGYYHGEIDGIWGAQSTRALAHYQNAHDLRGDGEDTALTDTFLAEDAGKALGMEAGRQKRRKDEGFLGRTIGDIGESL